LPERRPSPEESVETMIDKTRKETLSIRRGVPGLEKKGRFQRSRTLMTSHRQGPSAKAQGGNVRSVPKPGTLQEKKGVNPKEGNRRLKKSRVDLQSVKDCIPPIGREGGRLRIHGGRHLKKTSLKQGGRKKRMHLPGDAKGKAGPGSRKKSIIVQVGFLACGMRSEFLNFTA